MGGLPVTTRRRGADVLGSLPTVASGVRPVALAGQRVLAVPTALSALFPEGGLRRGSVIVIGGSAAPGGPAAPGGSASVGGPAAAGGTALALFLLSAASQAGSWCAAVGFPSLGLVAASELGIRLDRFALVPDPGDQWPVVTAALIDSVDAVLVCLPSRARPADTRRLVARARERGAVLVALGQDWPEGPDVRLTVTAATWHGLAAGYGHLQSRQVEVEASGRRAAARRRRLRLWLPGPGGTVAAVDPAEAWEADGEPVRHVVPAASRVS